MVKLGRDLQSRFPESIIYTSAKDYTFATVGPQGKVTTITQRNFDTLLFYDARTDGIKTGHVDEAGYHLVASAHDGDMRLLSAVMGTTSMEKRRVETKKAFDWAFRTFNTVHPDWHKIVPRPCRFTKAPRRKSQSRRPRIVSSPSSAAERDTCR